MRSDRATAIDELALSKRLAKVAREIEAKALAKLASADDSLSDWEDIVGEGLAKELRDAFISGERE